MAECKPTEKSNDDLDLSSISNILKIIIAAFNMFEKPVSSIPPPLLLIGKELRPGMSPRNLAARQMVNREEIGLPTGDVFNDGPNKEMQAMLADRKEEHFELTTKCKVEVALNPGAVQVTASGSAGPIPVVVQGSNTLYATAGGGLQ